MTSHLQNCIKTSRQPSDAVVVAQIKVIIKTRIICISFSDSSRVLQWTFEGLQRGVDRRRSGRKKKSGSAEKGKETA